MDLLKHHWQFISKKWLVPQANGPAVLEPKKRIVKVVDCGTDGDETSGGYSFGISSGLGHTSLVKFAGMKSFYSSSSPGRTRFPSRE